MQFLPYLAAHQLVHRLTEQQFDAQPTGEPEDIEVAARSRMESLRAGAAVLLRRTADRVEPAGVRSCP